MNNMTKKEKLVKELKSLGWITLYFLIWFGILMLVKVLLLTEYQIEFSGITIAFVGAIVVAKSILILEHVNFGSWINLKPAILDVVLRTILYVAGVFVVLLLEKGFEGSDEYGGFWSSLRSVFEHADIYHVWIATIGVTLAILFYNIFMLINESLGKGELYQIFFSVHKNQKHQK